MQLTIKDTSGIDLLPFMKECLIGQILNFIRAKFNSQLFSNYNKLFDINEYKKILFKQQFLRAYRVGAYTFIIDIDPSLMMKDGTSFLDCCRAIDQGTLSTSSYPIFTATFMSFKYNFWSYYEYVWRI